MHQNTRISSYVALTEVDYGGESCGDILYLLFVVPLCI